MRLIFALLFSHINYGQGTICTSVCIIIISIYLSATIGTRHLNKYRVLGCVYVVGLREAPGKCIIQTEDLQKKQNLRD